MTKLEFERLKVMLCRSGSADLCGRGSLENIQRCKEAKNWRKRQMAKKHLVRCQRGAIERTPGDITHISGFLSQTGNPAWKFHQPPTFGKVKLRINNERTLIFKFRGERGHLRAMNYKLSYRSTQSRNRPTPFAHFSKRVCSSSQSESPFPPFLFLDLWLLSFRFPSPDSSSLGRLLLPTHPTRSPALPVPPPRTRARAGFGTKDATSPWGSGNMAKK